MTARDCPGYHNGHASSRSIDSDTCTECGGHKRPVKALDCDCEPSVWADGSQTHEDDCAIYPWCPHEVGAFVCGVPCGCRCDGCLTLTLSHAKDRDR